MKKYNVIFSVFLMIGATMAVCAQRPAAQATPTPARPAATTPAPQVSTNVNVPISKMAVIYTDEFLDPKTGISKFNNLITKLNGEFQKPKDELTQMQQREAQLTEEIKKLQDAPVGAPIDQKSITTKVDQLEQLKKDIQRKGEDAQAAYNRRRNDLFGPLQEDIGRALEAFAKARNIHIIIDGTQVPLLYAASNIDITRAFINEFNSKNPVTASTTPPQ